MKTKLIRFEKCSQVARTLLLLLTFIVAGCNDPMFYDKPSVQACMKALVGQKLVLEKGALLDRTWTIEAKEFTSFAIEKIVKNSNGTATASMKFELTSGPKVLRVESEFEYRIHKKDHYVEFLSFKPTRLLKLGVW